MKKENEFKFKVGFSNNKFINDYSFSEDKINIKFKYYNDKIIICEIEDPQACQIYTQFASMNLFSTKVFKPEIYKDDIIFTGKAKLLQEDIYNKRIGESIALEKALEKRKAFYVMLMDLVNIRLTDIRHETHATIKNKWNNICIKNRGIKKIMKEIEKDKQLELPFEINQNYVDTI
jgi:hypothetical protein